MSHHEVDALLERYLEKECSGEERLLVESWYHNLKDPKQRHQLDPAIANVMQKRLWSAIKPVDRARSSYTFYFKIAVSIFIVTVVAVVLLINYLS